MPPFQRLEKSTGWNKTWVSRFRDSRNLFTQVVCQQFTFLTQGAERDVRDEAREPDQVAGGMAHGQQPQQGRHPNGLIGLLKAIILKYLVFSTLYRVFGSLHSMWVHMCYMDHDH